MGWKRVHAAVRWDGCEGASIWQDDEQRVAAVVVADFDTTDIGPVLPLLPAGYRVVFYRHAVPFGLLVDASGKVLTEPTWIVPPPPIQADRVILDLQKHVWGVLEAVRAGRTAVAIEEASYLLPAGMPKIAEPLMARQIVQVAQDLVRHLPGEPERQGQSLWRYCWANCFGNLIEELMELEDAGDS